MTMEWDQNALHDDIDTCFPHLSIVYPLAESSLQYKVRADADVQ